MSGWQTRPITRSAASGGETVNADVLGAWAAHPLGDGWAMSHVPSGLRSSVHAHTRAGARAAVEALVSALPWARDLAAVPDFSDPRNADLATALRGPAQAACDALPGEIRAEVRAARDATDAAEAEVRMYEDVAAQARVRLTRALRRAMDAGLEPADGAAE